MFGTFKLTRKAARSAPVEKLWMNGRKLVDLTTRKKIFDDFSD